MALFQSQAENDKSQKAVPDIIHGADKNDHPITIFGVGAINKNATSGLDTHSYGSIQCAILNCRGQDFDKARFPIACVNYTLLTKWMNRRLHLDSCKVEEETACHFTSIKFKSQEILEYDVMPGVRLRIEGNTLRDRSSGEMRLEWLYHAWFLFDKPVDARTILDKYASVFLRLLCLLTGERVFIDELFFWDGDPFKPAQEQIPQSFELLMPNRGITEAKRDCFAPYMIANFEEVAAVFGSILNQWFECHERLKPVLDLYFAVLSGLVLTDESQFLLLAQALEVYHARSKFDGSVQTTEDFRKRRDAILEKVPTEKGLG